MCKLICILTTAGNADVLCGSSDPAVLACSGVWGLFSFIALIVYLRWQGDHSSDRDEPADSPATTAPEGELLARSPPDQQGNRPETASLLSGGRD
jgi:hypothetical protein